MSADHPPSPARPSPALPPARSPAPSRDALLPVLAVIAGIATFSMMDAAMKSASLKAGVYSALFLRCLTGAALVAPFWAWRSPRLPGRRALRVHVLRSAVVACMAPLFFWGLVRLPMAEAIAISFIAPLIALYLAGVFLGEAIRPGAVLASLLGLAGVAVIGVARARGTGLGHGSLAGIAAVLASAVFYAVNLVLQRRQAQLAGPSEIALFQNLFVALLLAPAAPWLFAWPEAAGWRAIVLGAALAGIALVLLSWGYARAEAQVLLPIEYTGFAWAALLGWAWFGETVGWETVAGAVLIVAGCWIATRPAAPLAPPPGP